MADRERIANLERALLGFQNNVNQALEVSFTLVTILAKFVAEKTISEDELSALEEFINGGKPQDNGDTQPDSATG